MASPESVLSKKKLSIIGVGRLGLCTALIFEKAGWDVLAVDVVQSYVDSLNNKTLKSTEPGVMEHLSKSTKLRATTSLKEAVDYSDIIFILVATPTGSSSEETYDISTLSKVLAEINACQPKDKHIVICCTIMPGYISHVGNFLVRNCENCTLSYNPEFIAQGDVMRGLLKPDCVLIGEGSKEAGDILEALYSQCTENEPRMCRMSPQSAEIMKLSVNCFVTTKISFANMIGDIADRTPGADKMTILKAVGSDSRVGTKYLMPGYGFGGPCFPRDNRALGHYARSVGVPPLICDATDEFNKFHAEHMTKMLLAQDLDHYVITDVAYKNRCPVDIIEESQPLCVAKNLVKAGKKVTIRDRAGIIAIVQRHYGCLFLYEVAEPKDLEKVEHGFITNDANETVQFVQPLSESLSMGNPLSSYSK